MNIFQSNNDFEGILLNFAQNEPYVDNNLVGLIDNSNPGRGRNMEYQFYPGDAKTREASQQLQPLKPKDYNIIEFGPGKISPQPVTIVLPEMQSGLPNPIHSQNTQPNPDGHTKNLGVILGQVHYQNVAFVKSMQAVADQQPEILERMRELTVSSRLDEKEIERIGKTIDEVLGSVNRNTSNSENS